LFFVICSVLFDIWNCGYRSHCVW